MSKSSSAGRLGPAPPLSSHLPGGGNEDERIAFATHRNHGTPGRPKTYSAERRFRAFRIEDISTIAAWSIWSCTYILILNYCIAWSEKHQLAVLGVAVSGDHLVESHVLQKKHWGLLLSLKLKPPQKKTE